MNSAKYLMLYILWIKCKNPNKVLQEEKRDKNNSNDTNKKLYMNENITGVYTLVLIINICLITKNYDSIDWK